MGSLHFNIQVQKVSFCSEFSGHLITKIVSGHNYSNMHAPCLLHYPWYLPWYLFAIHFQWSSTIHDTLTVTINGRVQMNMT